jgi:hypothetical protein
LPTTQNSLPPISRPSTLGNGNGTSGLPPPTTQSGAPNGQPGNSGPTTLGNGISGLPTTRSGSMGPSAGVSGTSQPTTARTTTKPSPNQIFVSSSSMTTILQGLKVPFTQQTLASASVN